MIKYQSGAIVKKIYFFFFFVCLVSRLIYTFEQGISYSISVALDEKTHILKGSEEIHYQNNSEKSLNEVWLFLYANAYKDRYSPMAKKEEAFGDFSIASQKKEDIGYIIINEVKINGKRCRTEIYDYTNLKVILPEPLLAGESIKIEISFTHKIRKSLGRMGYDGRHYDMAQWYPKVAVFDEKGWRTHIFTFGEFYGPFADFSVTIDLPEDQIIEATGSKSDEKITDGIRHVTFKAEKVHDFAWVCDPSYVKEEGRVGDASLIVIYTKKNEKIWKNKVLKLAEDAMNFLNKNIGRYAYPKMVIAESPHVGGMEYPMLVMIRNSDQKWNRPLEWVIEHEIGHNWFYAMLANCEFEEAWLDEGLNTFQGIWYFEEKYGKKGNFSKIPNMLKPFIPSDDVRAITKRLYVKMARKHLEESSLKNADDYGDHLSYRTASYNRPAIFLIALRSMLGKETFGKGIKTYFERFRLKRVKTEDFISVMEEVSGQGLKEFFAKTLSELGQVDYAIGKIKKKKIGNKYLYDIEIKNKGNVSIPGILTLYSSEDKENIHFEGKEKTEHIRVPLSFPLKKAIIDEEHDFPDIHEINNSWNIPVKFGILTPFLRQNSLDSINIRMAPVAYYNLVDHLRYGFAFDIGGFETDPCASGILTKSSTNNRLGWDINFSVPLINFGAHNTMDASIFDLEGRRGYKISLNHITGKHETLTYPYIDSTLYISTIDAYDRNYLRPSDWNLGRLVKTGVKETFRLNEPNASFSLTTGFDLSQADIGGGKFSYLKGYVEILFSSMATDKDTMNLRFFFGEEGTQSPAQDRFFVDSASPVDSIYHFYTRTRGAIPFWGSYHLPGGGNGIAYITDDINATRLASVNVFLHRNITQSLSARIFGDFVIPMEMKPVPYEIHKVKGVGLSGQVLGDAGFGLILQIPYFDNVPLRIDFPIYKSTLIDRNERLFAPRVVFSFQFPFKP